MMLCVQGIFDSLFYFFIVLQVVEELNINWSCMFKFLFYIVFLGNLFYDMIEDFIKVFLEDEILVLYVC